MTVSRHKELVFGITGGLMLLNYWLLVVRPRDCRPGDICHIDNPVMRWNRRIYWFSLMVFAAAIVLTYGSLWILS